MNLSEADTVALASSISCGLKNSNSTVVLCPPAIFITSIRPAISKNIKIGGQNCSHERNGAFTGEISSDMLKNSGAEYVILGHSERRKVFNECNTTISKKAVTAINSGLKTIICVGENLEERKAKKEKEVVKNQLKKSIPPISNSQNTIIAYEPVWAIGTGENATDKQISEMHDFIKAEMPGYKILYGGSVTSKNSANIMKIKNVDGLLVGGASLNASEFLKICEFN